MQVIKKLIKNIMEECIQDNLLGWQFGHCAMKYCD